VGRPTGRPSAPSHVAALVVGLLVAITALQVQAESADDIVQRGLELRRKRKDEEALAEFKKAWAIAHTPRIQVQIALAEQALGLWVVAEEDLLSALIKKDDPWTKKNLARLTSTLAVIQNHIASLEVWGTPAGAAIFANGKPVGTLPLKGPLRVADESVVLRAEAAGHLDWTRTVRLELGQTVRQHLEMVPVPTSAAREPVSAVATIAPTTPPSQSRPDLRLNVAAKENAQADSTEKDTGEHGAHALRPFAWAAGGAALLGLGLGVTESIVARGKRDDFNGKPECGTSALTAGCSALANDYNRAGTLALVGYAAGGGLAVVSTIFFLLSADGDREPTHVATRCRPEPRGVSCLLSF
jgi:hypothetical protein